MYALKIERSKRLGFIPLSLLVMCLVGCGLGTNATTSGAAAGTVTATCTVSHLKNATGTIQSISATSFSLKDALGKSVQASYSTKTRFQREMAVTSAALQEGTFVSVVVNQDANTTYTATLVTLLANRGNGAGSGSGRGFGGTGQARNTSCFRARSGSPTNVPGATGSSSTSSRGITGTVGQISKSVLTVTDLQGSDYTVTLSPTTKIIKFETATASVLHAGSSLSITGTDDGKGGVIAQNVTILLVA